MPGISIPRPTQRNLFLFTLLVVTTGLAYLAVILPIYNPFASDTILAGSIAKQDAIAPTSLTYDSKLLTDAERERAAAQVAPIYTAPDANVSRNQVEKLRNALAFISTVRNDGFATEEQKLADLQALENLTLPKETVLAILGLNESRWQVIQQEAISVLEQVMRSSIREDEIKKVKSQVPLLISSTMPSAESKIVSTLVSGFVTANSLYNQEETVAAREQARKAIVTVTRSYQSGQIIVQRGAVITPENLEALEAFGLAETTMRWQDFVAPAAIVIAVMLFVTIYLLHTYRNKGREAPIRGLAVNAALFILFLFAARIISPGRTVLPYLVPLAAYSLLISTLFNNRQALITTLPLAILSTYGLAYAQELTLYYLLSGLFGVLILDRGNRISAFFWTGIGIAVSGTAVVIAYRLTDTNTDWIGIATLIGAALAYGVFSTSITLLLQHTLAQILGKVTALQLYELSRPDHPLLKQLLQKAPGTYQHTLQVANLVEQAAERIGADPLLARVGALYHDVGKIERPQFFIENQVPGSENPHDSLPPQESASIIIQHVTDGLALAKKYRIPLRIRDFIAEHHGASIAQYQYSRAVREAGGDESLVDREQYIYPGANPCSRETALLMLADASEARMRADRPKNEDELSFLIQSVIGQRLNSGALQDCDLTLNDIKVIVATFTESLRGIYHPRIQYPDQKTKPISSLTAPEKPAQLEEQSHEPQTSESGIITT